MKNLKLIIVMGPPGSGKGTQAELLKKDLKFEHISTGELFRNEIEKKSKLGLKARNFIEEGKFVPDELTIDLLLNKIKELKNEHKLEGIILDGFPRTLEQAQFLDTKLNELESKIFKVIYYKLDDKKDIERIKHRAEEDIKKGKNARADDLDENIIKQRLDVYHEKTEPIIKFYKQKKILIEINADNDINKILEKTENSISE